MHNVDHGTQIVNGVAWMSICIAVVDFATIYGDIDSVSRHLSADNTREEKQKKNHIYPHMHSHQAKGYWFLQRFHEELLKKNWHKLLRKITIFISSEIDPSRDSFRKPSKHLFRNFFRVSPRKFFRDSLTNSFRCFQKSSNKNSECFFRVYFWLASRDPYWNSSR